MNQNSPTELGASDVKVGLICAVGAYFLWGILPIYLKQLGSVDPVEIVAHRIFWSVPFGAMILTVRSQWGEARAALTDKRVLSMLLASSIVIAANWLIYVWAVANDRVLQASLGYFINPLMFVAAGFFVLKEKLNRVQVIALCFAALGVLVLTFGSGIFPWVSIILAISFTAYGYLRKTVNIGGMPGLFIETAILAPAALGFLIWLNVQGTASWGSQGSGIDTLLVLAGPVTVIPLLLFALASRRLRFSTIGFLQYIGPSLQFSLGLYYGEQFTTAHAICFGLIWFALAIFSVDAYRNRPRAK